MALIPVVNPTLAGVTYVSTAASVSDTFAAQQGATYLVNIECVATNTVTFKDINTPLPPGAAANATFADVAVVVGANTKKSVKVSANRFLNSGTGLVNITAANATSTTYTILGPL